MRKDKKTCRHQQVYTPQHSVGKQTFQTIVSPYLLSAKRNRSHGKNAAAPVYKSPMSDDIVIRTNAYRRNPDDGAMPDCWDTCGENNGTHLHW